MGSGEVLQPLLKTGKERVGEGVGKGAGGGKGKDEEKNEKGDEEQPGGEANWWWLHSGRQSTHKRTE